MHLMGLMSNTTLSIGVLQQTNVDIIRVYKNC